MSYIGATGYTQYEERFQDIEGRIDIDERNTSNILKDLYVGNYSITSNLNRVIHTSSNIFSNLYIGDDCITSNIIKIFNREGITYDDLYAGDNSFASNIKYLKNEVQNETLTTPKTAIYRVKDLEIKFNQINNGFSSGNLIDAETGVVIGNSIANAFSCIGANIANIGNTAAIWYFLGQCAIAAQVGQTRAETANTKADKSLGIWDENGNDVYHKKSGNVGIGTTFGSVLTNKLEVNGNINIPTGSSFRINNEPLSYSDLAGTPPVSSKWTNATDTATNIYYNCGNVGIGVISSITNKLEVDGSVNISAGNKNKINGVNLAFSDLGGTLSYNSLTDKLTAGTNINIVNNAINNTYTYTLPTAGTGAGGALGGVKVEGSTITVNGSGVISAAAATPQVNSDWTQTNTSSKAFIQNKPNAGTNISFANNAITNSIIRSPTQNIIALNNNELIIRDKANSGKTTNVDVPLTSFNEPLSNPSRYVFRAFTHSGLAELQTPHTFKDVGSGAGGDDWEPDGGVSGKGLKNSIVDIFSSGNVYSKGNDGGTGGITTTSPFAGQGAGGGGAGTAGGNGGLGLTNASPGDGGDGLSGISEINHDFKTNFGNYGKLETDGKYWLAGGRGGGAWEVYTPERFALGGKGGGGLGSIGNEQASGGNAFDNTGSGGGGGSAA
jgi:hypothetical protein